MLHFSSYFLPYYIKTCYRLKNFSFNTSGNLHFKKCYWKDLNVFPWLRKPPHICQRVLIIWYLLTDKYSFSNWSFAWFVWLINNDHLCFLCRSGVVPASDLFFSENCFVYKEVSFLNKKKERGCCCCWKK